MDLRSWIVAEHDALVGRFETSIAAHVPRDRWTDRAGEGGSSIAFLVFHTTWHEDLAMAVAARRAAPLMVDHRERLGLGGLPEHRGLGEVEDTEVTERLELEALLTYADAVHRTTSEWLTTADLDGLDEPVEPAGRLESLGGVDETQVPWLVGMWTGRPLGWFVQWEAMGHRQNHLGEMISVRSRLGLSPF
jgi:hypothetical protein